MRLGTKVLPSGAMEPEGISSSLQKNSDRHLHFRRVNPGLPTYLVRVAFSLEGEKLPPRYFWLGWPRFDREVSPFFWNVSL